MLSLLQHFWVAISMVFFVAATTFTLLKLSGKFSFLTKSFRSCSSKELAVVIFNDLVVGVLL